MTLRRKFALLVATLIIGGSITALWVETHPNEHISEKDKPLLQRSHDYTYATALANMAVHDQVRQAGDDLYRQGLRGQDYMNALIKREHEITRNRDRILAQKKQEYGL